MTYIVSFNSNVLYTDHDIHQRIISIPGLKEWWRYTNFSYILKTQESTAPFAITRHIRESLPFLQHIVLKVDLKENSGLLPKEAWDWINRVNGYNTPLNKVGLPPIMPENPKTLMDFLKEYKKNK